MRMTVGPLPSAVYWRRRAIVLVAILLPVIVLLYSCTGGGDPKASTGGEPTPTPELTSSVLTPETGAPPTSEQPAAPPSTATPPTEQAPQSPAPQNPPPAAGEQCTDAEMSVIPVPSQVSAQRGVTVEIRLKIKNTSGRTCTRDVGADMQEIYVKQGAEKVWSSDTCGNVRGTNVQTFIPNHEMEFRVGWNGKTTSKCANSLAAGPDPTPGDYQIIGRLDQKLSEPVRFTITN